MYTHTNEQLLCKLALCGGGGIHIFFRNMKPYNKIVK